MRRLLLMRHATAGSSNKSDYERPLTEIGRDEAYRVGLRLSQQKRIPERILSSAALRCRQTTQAVVSGLSLGIETDFESRLYNAASDGLLDAIAEVDDAHQSILVIAHNPGISLLALGLAGTSRDRANALQRGFSPASVACFEIDADWSALAPRNAKLIDFE